MSSGFSGWWLSELGQVGITDLQLVTLVIAYLCLALFGLHDFYTRPLAHGAPGVAADAPPAPARGGQALAWIGRVQHPLLLLLFCASVLKLSAQSYSPFLYFQF